MNNVLLAFINTYINEKRILFPYKAREYDINQIYIKMSVKEILVKKNDSKRANKITLLPDLFSRLLSFD